jgi:uncharacterized protein (UPF0332 family)
VFITGRILRNGYNSRTKGDYDAFVVFSASEVEYMLKDMEIFVSEIERLIK